MSERPKRKYEQRQRAELQAHTRTRITEAAVKLHSTVGPARTTVTAIAQHAGVRRATVYRHFPDERAIFQACSGHVAATNPPPDPSPWWRIADPEQRLAVALDELYDYYERNADLLSNIMRDRETMPILREVGARRIEYFAQLERGLARGWHARGRRSTHLRAAIALALDFGAWRMLVRVRGLDRADAVAVMLTLVAGVAPAPIARR